MSTQVVIRVNCDVCSTTAETENGRSSEIQTVPLNVFGDEYEMDLCQNDRDRIKAILGEFLVHARQVGKKKRPGRQPKSSTARRIERADDGRLYCDHIDCDKSYGSDSGLRHHLEQAHGDTDFTIAWDGPPVAPKPRKTATKRATKKATPRKRVLQRA